MRQPQLPPISLCVALNKIYELRAVTDAFVEVRRLQRTGHLHEHLQCPILQPHGDAVRLQLHDVKDRASVVRVGTDTLLNIFSHEIECL